MKVLIRKQRGGGSLGSGGGGHIRLRVWVVVTGGRRVTLASAEQEGVPWGRGGGSTPPEEQESDLPPLGCAGPTVSLELTAVPQEGPGPWQGEHHFCYAKPC